MLPPRRGYVRPDFENWYTAAGGSVLSVMPLVLGLWAEYAAERTISAICHGEGTEGRLAIALGLTEAYVTGYADGWFGRPPSTLTDNYADGVEDGVAARERVLARIGGGR